MGIGREIATAVVAHLISDLAKLDLGEHVSPVEQAIAATAQAYPDIEGLETTLRNWLRMRSVEEALQQFVAGVTGPTEVPLEQLVSAMVDPETGFAMLAGTEQTATAIVRTFLDSIRAAYWGSPQVGLPALAKRLEHGLAQVDLLVDAVGTFPTHSALHCNSNTSTPSPLTFEATT